MRKIILLILIVNLYYTTYSQDSRIVVGLELTPTITTIRGIEQSARFSYSTGFTIDYIVNKTFTFKSGLLYERKGVKSSIEFTDNTGTFSGNTDDKFNYDYLILPILGSFSTQDKNKIYVNAGPFLGLLLSQKDIYSAFGNYPKITHDNYNIRNKIDVGLSLGIGILIPIKDKFLLDLGLKENLGLINIVKSTTGSAKTNSFGLQIGLKYKL